MMMRGNVSPSCVEIGAVIGVLLLHPATAISQERLDPIVVTATRNEERAFELPLSIDSLDAAQIQQNQLQINLSESLVRVPGLSVQNRWNYAQDLQVSSRGFGARAAFGVRGIRLYQDGIPATIPDGQGQTGSFSLASAKRIDKPRMFVLGLQQTSEERADGRDVHLQGLSKRGVLPAGRRVVEHAPGEMCSLIRSRRGNNHRRSH